MSMHKIPLTDIEREGIIKHGLVIGIPSQLTDAFRQGVMWGLNHANGIKLTGEMIAELCGFAGFSFDREELDESLAEDEFTIRHCPSTGVREDDGSIGHYQYVVIAENGDDGEVFPLGPKLVVEGEQK